jgi:DNA-binding CsgD family transcriptional regulator
MGSSSRARAFAPRRPLRAGRPRPPRACCQNSLGPVHGHFREREPSFVAHRNEPCASDPRGLAPREVQAAEYLGQGYTIKEIAYALGLGTSTVTSALRRARVKLAMRSLAELGAFFAPHGLRARLAECELAGLPLLVASVRLREAELETLSPAERDVALWMVRGATTREIALRRAVSERTVANQIQSLYGKLGVGSRSELAARLSSGRDRPDDGAATLA